jgi:hypothetical protein
VCLLKLFYILSFPFCSLFLQFWLEYRDGCSWTYVSFHRLVYFRVITRTVLPVAIPQIVASAGAINLFIVVLCVSSKNHSGSSWELDDADDEHESKVLAISDVGETRCRRREIGKSRSRRVFVSIVTSKASFLNVAMKIKSNERMEISWLCPGLG